jgi:hypothetical protein
MPTDRIVAAATEGWNRCLQTPGSLALPIANFVYRLRSDATWTEDEIRQVVALIRDRLQNELNEKQAA